MKIGSESTIYPSAKLCHQELISIGSRVIIDDFVFIAGQSGVFIGDFVHIGVHSLISGQGEVRLESFSGLSSGVRLFSSTEIFDGDNLTNPTIPSLYREVKSGPIVIGKHAVVCANSVIMPNVTIGEGAVIGANSLVTKSVEPWGVYQGMPLRKIKTRKSGKILELEKRLRDQGKHNDK